MSTMAVSHKQPIAKAKTDHFLARTDFLEPPAPFR